MSKKKPPKKFRKQREREETLLRELADAITACEKAKMRPKLYYDMVFTTVGYVLPPLEKGGRWDARSVLASPYEDVMDSFDLCYLTCVSWFGIYRNDHRILVSSVCFDLKVLDSSL